MLQGAPPTETEKWAEDMLLWTVDPVQKMGSDVERAG